MSRQRILGSLLAAIVVPAALLSSCRKQEPATSPPATPTHAQFPPAFDQALKAALERVHSHPKDPNELRKLARLYQANRYAREARACYVTIAAMPGGLSAQDHYYLAHLALTDGDLDAAQPELRKVIEGDPNYLPSRVVLADALFKSGQSDDAAKEYTAILAIEPKHLAASVGLARIELQRGENDAALARLEQILTLHPETTQGADLLAHELSRRGDKERATALTKGTRDKHEPVPADPWLDALLSDSFDGQSLALRCEEYILAGQIDLAVPLLDRVEMLEPKSWIPHVLRGWYEGRAHHFTEGVLEYNKALEVGADPDKICPLITNLLIESGKLADAAELARAFYAKEPDSVPILSAYADIAVRQKDEKTARVLLQRLLEKEPYLYLPNMNYANILWTAGEKDAAIPCLKRVAAVFPHDVASRGLLAEYYLDKSDPLSAIAPLEQALPDVPANSATQKRMMEMLQLAYDRLTESLLQKGQLAEAANYYERSTKLNPSNLPALAALANCYVELKRFKEAADALDKLSKLDPKNPTILLSLGDVLSQSGAPEQARAHWTQALGYVAPGDTELAEAIKSRLNGGASPEAAR